MPLPEGFRIYRLFLREFGSEFAWNWEISHFPKLMCL
jgi:hypothetical protein